MTKIYNFDPYYDDFDEDKNFMRILFRPGYSVQARELTQLQTILSNQIEKFGNHIFKNGSPIIGGKINLDRRANYVLLQSQYNNSDIVLSDFLNKTIISSGSGKFVKAKVVAIDTTANALVLKYLGGDVFAEGETIKVLGQEIYASLKTTDAVGGSFVANLEEGIYYFKGQFVKVTPQVLIVQLIYRQGYNSATVVNKPSFKLGIQFTETEVDEIDDVSLLDPAQGAFNYQAPGANRYQVQTTLSKRSITSTETSTFFEVVRIVDDVKTKEIESTQYSEISKMLARRTYDESGNYTVDPFIITLDEGDSANGKFQIQLDPGKAYVGGYEFETISPTKISVDRARETAVASQYDLPTNYSSTLVVDTVAGALDITAYPVLDIHSVPVANVNTTNGNAYNSTKIGTLRTNMIKYNDSTIAEVGNTHSFSLHVFDTSTTPITGTLVTGSSTTVIKLPANFSSTAGANAYANMYFRITDGTYASFPPVLISSSDSAANTVTLSVALAAAPGANTFSIESDIRNAESVVANNALSPSFSGNINSDSKDTTTGFVSIVEPKNSALIFDTPFTAIKEESISNMNFYVRKLFSGQVTTGGKFTLQAGSNESFSFSTGSDASLLDNIICFVRSGANTALDIKPNTVLSLANNNFTVTKTGTTIIEIDTGASETITADFLVTTKINNAEVFTNNYTKKKKLIPVNTGVDLHSKVPYEMGGANTLDDANTSVNTSVSGVGVVFEDIGATNFTDSSILTDLRTPGKVVSLQVPDVYELVGIFDSKSNSSNVTTAMLSDTSYNITDNYDFDNGQRKSYYDHATIKLKRGYSAPIGRVFVQYRYFKNTSAYKGLFTVDSYTHTDSNTDYADISYFANQEDNKLVNLRSAFDFRPYRTVGTSTLTGGLNPEPLENINMTFDYYLSRIDQIIIKEETLDFAVIRGASAVTPIAPPVKDRDMLIYTLTIPAYTENVKDVRADFKNHRRYTMGDIQRFEDRIRGLEYYVSLSNLEKDAASTKVLDSAGNDRSKYGILVDNFTTKDNQALRTDVGTDNRNLLMNGRLYPASLMRTVNLLANTAASIGSTKFVGSGVKKSLMIQWSSTSEFAKQPYATKSMPIATAMFANFNGTTKLFPEFTSDVDTGVVSKVTINSTKGLDDAMSFINTTLKFIGDKMPAWRKAKDSPFAQIADSKYYTVRQEVDVDAKKTVGIGDGWLASIAPINDNTYLTKGAELQQKQILTSTSEVDVGTFVTDLAFNPYMKPKQILFASQSLRPNTIFYNFFDNVDVNKYIVVPNKVTLNAASTFKSGESILIAGSIADLTLNVASLVSGNTQYNAAFVVVSEPSGSEISIINENDVALSSLNYVYGIDSGTFMTITSVNDHRSGVGTVATNTIVLSGDASTTDSYYNGNTLTVVRTFTSAEGIGEQFTISSYVGSTRTATLSGTPTNTGKVVYSIGTNRSNKFGQVGGAFYMPKATFVSGQRNFRTTESINNTYDADSISFADKTYVSSGATLNKTTLVDTVSNLDVSFKVVDKLTRDRLVSFKKVGDKELKRWHPDPLAETFFVDGAVYPDGVFLESLDLFFKSKDDENLPVSVQIRPTENGVPSSDYWIPESVVVKYPDQINISENPSTSNTSTQTKFTFDYPVFLKPGMYAVVVITDSPEYIVWASEKGATALTGEYVDRQPYLGTLYKSQTTFDYTPFLNEDLMFRLNRCVFPTNTSATFSLVNERQDNAILVDGNMVTANVYYDKLRLLQNSIIPSKGVTDITYSIITKTISGAKETTFREISPNQTYNYSTDNLYQVGYRRKVMLEQGDTTVKLEMNTTNDAVSPVVSLESLQLNVWENFIDNGEINAEDFTIVSQGGGYSNANTIVITSTSGTGAVANLIVNGSGNVVGINVSSTGSGYLDDFSISYYNDPNYPATIVLNSEYDSSGGPCLARYITKPIILADGYDAGDLRVFLSANKPGTSEVHVFYKMLSASDPSQFKDRPYQKLVCVNPNSIPSPNENTFTDYEYRPNLTVNQITYTGENGVTYDTFKTFAIKIVLTSNDPAIVPSVKDLRIIATPGE